jgi:hypothetical protein
MASYLPGHYFSLGQHNVLYQATDADGNKAKCGFTINVVPANGRGSHKQGQIDITRKNILGPFTIFKIFSQKLVFFTRNKAKLCKNLIITLLFEKNACVFPPKSVENSRNL